MTLAEFKQSLNNAAPPSNLSLELEALWWDGRGDWHRAHDVVQDVSGAPAAWIHAYLHRKEGDAANAGYWYSRAGRPMVSVSLEEEWSSIVEYFLRSF